MQIAYKSYALSVYIDVSTWIDPLDQAHHLKKEYF